MAQTRTQTHTQGVGFLPAPDGQELAGKSHCYKSILAISHHIFCSIWMLERVRFDCQRELGPEDVQGQYRRGLDPLNSYPLVMVP